MAQRRQPRARGSDQRGEREARHRCLQRDGTEDIQRQAGPVGRRRGLAVEERAHLIGA